MKIKLAILDSDTNYLDRISSVFTNKFSDKLEMYSFTDANVALSSLKSAKINVFIASDTFDIDTAQLPRHCGFAYLVESSNIETYKGSPAVCKFQKIEMIYKTILEIFSDNVSDSIGIKFDSDSSVQIIAFVSASGGVGSSCLAAACAKSFVASGKKTLYLNLEQLGSVEPFFSGAGQTDFSDVIFALKNKKANLSLKLESNVRQDASGVFFYAAPKTALDVMELKLEEIQRLINDLKLVGSYDSIILDMDFSFSASVIEILKQSSAIVFVSDGSDISNIKFLRAHRAIEIKDRESDTPLLPRISLFYNKSSKRRSKAADIDVRVIGTAPPYEGATTEQAVTELAALPVFHEI